MGSLHPPTPPRKASTANSTPLLQLLNHGPLRRDRVGSFQQDQSNNDQSECNCSDQSEQWNYRTVHVFNLNYKSNCMHTLYLWPWRSTYFCVWNVGLSSKDLIFHLSLHYYYYGVDHGDHYQAILSKKARGLGDRPQPNSCNKTLCFTGAEWPQWETASLRVNVHWNGKWRKSLDVVIMMYWARFSSLFCSSQLFSNGKNVYHYSYHKLFS